jgi:arylsulfatase A-like enzyme
MGSPAHTDDRADGRSRAGALGLAWLSVAAGELYFAGQGFQRPLLWQALAELLVLPGLGYCQLRLLPSGWLRSPLWPGVAVAAGTALVFGPDGVFAFACFALGLGGVCVAGVRRVEARWRVGWIGGLAAALLGVAAARYQVLVHSPHQDEQAMSATAPSRQLLAELAGGFAHSPRPAPVALPPVVVLSIDTLRADHMLRMQSWQRLARRGATWERAMSTSSWTLPAMASLQSGVLPAAHGAGFRDGRVQPLAPEVETLAETLAGAGYLTAAVLTNSWLVPELGFARGFREYAHVNTAFHHRLLLAGFPRRPAPHTAEAVVDRALAWLDTAPERGFYLWVHLVDPHLPYLHAEPGSLAAKLSDERLRSGERLDAAQREQVRQAYAAEVAYTDHQLERLLDALERRGVLDQGVVVLTADHGEELWDHGATGHGHAHHAEVIDVALALIAPGVAPGPRSGLASLVDVAPTIRAAVGLPARGYDLRQPLPEGRIAVAYGNAYFETMRSARQRDRRVIVVGAETRELRCSDRLGDPLERVARDCPRDDALVAAALGVAGPAAGRVAEVPVQALQALGYVVD